MMMDVCCGDFEEAERWLRRAFRDQKPIRSGEGMPASEKKGTKGGSYLRRLSTQKLERESASQQFHRGMISGCCFSAGRCAN